MKRSDRYKYPATKSDVRISQLDRAVLFPSYTRNSSFLIRRKTDSPLVLAVTFMAVQLDYADTLDIHTYLGTEWKSIRPDTSQDAKPNRGQGK